MTESEMLDSWEAAIVQIVAHDPDGYLDFIGTGFIIASFGRAALVVTATHVLEGVQQRHQPRPRSHPSTPDFFVSPSSKQLRLERGVHALHFAAPGKVDMCNVTWTSTLDGLDIAFLGIEQRSHYQGGEFSKKFDLDSRPIRVGERVYAVGSRLKLAADQVVKDEVKLRHTTATVTRSLVSVVGNVVESWVGGTEGRPWPAFQIAVATEPGMSGGPVLRLLEGRIGICGVISRGWMFDVPDLSTIAAIWPAMLTDVHVNLEGWKGPVLPRILDIVEAQVVSDVNAFSESFRVHPIPDDPDRMSIEVLDRTVYAA